MKILQLIYFKLFICLGYKISFISLIISIIMIPSDIASLLPIHSMKFYGCFIHILDHQIFLKSIKFH